MILRPRFSILVLFLWMLMGLGYGNEADLKVLVEDLIAKNGTSWNFEQALAQAKGPRARDGDLRLDTDSARGNRHILDLAAMAGCLDLVKYIVEVSGISPKTVKLGSLNSFQYASQSGQLEVVKYFLGSGKVEIDAKWNNGEEALNLAIRANQTEVAVYLIESGAAISPSMVSTAVNRNNVDIVRAIAATGQDLDTKQSYYGASPPIVTAVEKGNLEMVKLLAENGADINPEPKSYKNTLLLAANYGHIQIVKFFLDQGLDPRGPYSTYSTILEEIKETAARTNRTEIVDFIEEYGPRGASGQREVVSAVKDGELARLSELIENNYEYNRCLPLDKESELNNQAGNQGSPLHEAVAHNQTGAIKLLLDQSDIAKDRKCYGDGITPLILAVKTGDLGMVKILVENGADIESSSESTKQTPLGYAAEHAQIEIAKYLLAKGADKNGKAKYGPGEYIMMYAVRSGDAQMAKLLADAGSQYDPKYGSTRTPLYEACALGHLDIVKMFYDQGVSKPFGVPNSERPLNLAAKSGNLDLVKYLIESRKSDDIYWVNNDGHDPFVMSVMTGDMTMTRYFVEENDYKIGNNVMPMRKAAENDDVDMMKYLKTAAGGDLFNGGYHGYAPFHAAATSGSMKALKYLLDEGQDINVTCIRSGNTALLYALLANKVETAKFLAGQGADASIKNKSGKTSVDIAKNLGFTL